MSFRILFKKAERSVPLVVISAGNDSFTESDMLKKD